MPLLRLCATTLLHLRQQAVQGFNLFEHGVAVKSELGRARVDRRLQDGHANAP